jgi:hypothetical protein
MLEKKKENNKESPSNPLVLLVSKGILACNGQTNRGIYSYTLSPLGFHVRYGIFIQYGDTKIPFQFNPIITHHELKLSEDF